MCGQSCSVTTLYVDKQFLSPASMSAFVALNEKKIAFELATIDLEAGQQKTDAYAALSLTQRVPTLAMTDFSLSESSAIAEYLEDIADGTLLFPRDVRQRARARQLQAWLRSDLLALRGERGSETIFQPGGQAPLSPAAQSAADKLVGVVEALLPAGASHFFESWSIADFDAGLMLARLARNGDPLPPRLARFSDEQMRRASFSGWPAWVTEGARRDVTA